MASEDQEENERQEDSEREEGRLTTGRWYKGGDTENAI